MTRHQFGGVWTERKLLALREYLRQYQTIFQKNPSAQKLQTIYVDAFAGTGDREDRKAPGGPVLFGYSDEATEFRTGSAKIALDLELKFHKYIFIDRKREHITRLASSVAETMPELRDRCLFLNEDANVWLRQWCLSESWRMQRAVVFLDPYGMSVEWSTIEAIAKTASIDLWVLFPFAIGANRMMPSEGLPDTEWGLVLSKVFGSSEWVSRFYGKRFDTDLFGQTTTSITKIVGADEILQYFLERLRSVFPHVVSRPLILYNSNNSPMYALCFAAGNKKGGKTAVKIAEYLARSK